MNDPERLLERLRTEALRRGFRLEDNPAALTQPRMRAKFAEDADGSPPDVVTPSVVLGFRAEAITEPGKPGGQHAVLIGCLADAGEDLSAVSKLWRRYHGQAAIARSWLPEAAADDLCLVLIGPAGSAREPFWITQTAEIERNDLVCRKLVWLPPAAEADEERDESLDHFVARTFLARPWETGSDASQRSLDSLATILAELPDLGAPPETVRAWLAVLGEHAEEESSRDALVAKLIAALPPPPSA